MRDSLSILDQSIAMGDGAIEYDSLINMLGLVTNEHLFTLTGAITNKNIEKAMNIIDEVVYAGKDIYLFIKDLVGHYRNILMVKVTNNPEEVLDMAEENIALIKEQGARIRVEEVMRAIRILQEAEGNAKLSKQARLYLELATIQMCKVEYDTSNEIILARLNKLEEGLKNGSLKVVQSGTNQQANTGENAGKKQLGQQTRASQPQSSAAFLQGNVNSKVTINDVQRSWKDILEKFKARRAMIIYASILTGKPVSCINGIVTIQYEEEYRFNKDRLDKTDNKKVINEVFAEIFREDIKVAFSVDESANEEKSTEEQLLETLGSGLVDFLDE